MKGWVYVISNKGMPGLVKVGHSTKYPELRAKELNHTGFPHPHLVDYWMLIEDPYQIEQKIHHLLSSKREAKEWFRCTPEEAIAAAKQIAGPSVIIENYTRAERAKAEALHQQKIKEQEAILAREKAEKDIEERLRNEESAILEKFKRQFEARLPSAAYRALEKQRDEELAAVRWRVVSSSIDKKTTEKANISQKVEDYNKVIQLNPDDANAHINRGNAYYNLGQYQRAIEDYNEAIRLKPDDAMAYYNRGTDYCNLGQYQRAIEDYNEAIRLKPVYEEAYNNRGLAYCNLGQYQRAIEDYNEAIRLKPDYAGAYNNRGGTYIRLGQYQRAIEDFNEAIRLQPDNAGAYNNRGIAYSRLHNDNQSLLI